MAKGAATDRAGRGRRRQNQRRSYAEAATATCWLDSLARPPAEPPLEGEAECEPAIVGGGPSGLWAALLEKQDEPDRECSCSADRIANAGELWLRALDRLGLGFDS